MRPHNIGLQRTSACGLAAEAGSFAAQARASLNSQFIVIVFACALLAQPVRATSIATVSLADLFKEADVVAVLHTDVGTGIGARVALNRAKVDKAFKGVRDGAVLTFGPYGGYRVGFEYVVFLRKTKELVGAQFEDDTDPGFRQVFGPETPYFQTMYAGYSILPVEYRGEFGSNQDCVRICDGQILLPDSLRRIRVLQPSGASREVWVPFADFVSYLKSLVEHR